MRQLTSLDAQFLALETRASVRARRRASRSSIRRRRRPARSRLADIEALITDRLPLLPPLRWRLREVPLGLDYPYWVDDADFDLHFHVRELGLRRAGQRRAARRAGGADRLAAAGPRPAAVGAVPHQRPAVRPRRDAHEDPPRGHRRPVGRRDPRAAARPDARDPADRDDRPVGRQRAGAQRPRDARAGHRRRGALPAAGAASAAVGAAEPRGDAVQGDPRAWPRSAGSPRARSTR